MISNLGESVQSSSLSLSLKIIRDRVDLFEAATNTGVNHAFIIIIIIKK